jgi:hypothetical protein
VRSWCVGTEQARPYEYLNLEVFEEERDALAWAAVWAEGHGGTQLSKRRWRLPEDGQTLIVWRRMS